MQKNYFSARNYGFTPERPNKKSPPLVAEGYGIRIGEKTGLIVAFQFNQFVVQT